MITTVCYGDERIWDDRVAAMNYFFEGMCASDGCEKERYSKIFEELTMGFDYCTDDPDKIGKDDIRELLAYDDH